MIPIDEFPVEVTSDEGLYRQSDTPLSASMKKAAVLIPLVRVEDAWHLLFIVRAANPRDRHSGQVAFPGGRQDKTDDSLIATALRETHEEIGVQKSNIQVVGALSDYVTVSQYAVTPIVGVMDWPQSLVLQTDEVARTLTLPIDWLSDRSNFTLRARHELDPQSSARHPVIVYKEQQDATLWGATARMTVNCIKAFADGQFEVHPALQCGIDERK